MANNVTWKELIEEEMEARGESYSDIVFKYAYSEHENWDKIEFRQSYGTANGEPFIVYTLNYIYFPTTYDGWEECVAIPRNPNENWMPKHYGGE